ncbi:SRPBCC domain-containing protein [Lewinella sp. 4G2]|uniref:SRPBCC family protein n=1 Tax=Lewinella sp. 4G2 TaxID=1803372 RepID=UPI0007B4DE7B|nr:SRPBCC domain-containing protein [Lewinella sp. 4G2]OAV44771.1 hypothetical protein A3850_009840 [Lewinella sp. 4G2]
MKKSIATQKRYPHPIEKVWRAITDPELVSQWLMPTDIKAEVGHRFTFQTDPYPGFDGTVHCEVFTVEEPYELAYTWSGGGLKNTTITFRLKDNGDGTTTLNFHHAGFAGFLNRLIARNVLASGWRGKLLSRQLPALLNDLS